MEKKIHAAFLCYPCHHTSYISRYFILHYNSVLNCKFIWKSYLNFSFIEFTFLIEKDTNLLTYLQIKFGKDLMNTKDLFFKDGDAHFSDGERYLLTYLLTNKVWEDLINAKDILL